MCCIWLFWRFLRQGRVTWLSHPLRSSARNTSSLLLSFVLNTSSYNTFSFPLWAPYGRGKNLEPLLVLLRKTFLILLKQVRSWPPPVFAMEFVHYFPGVYQPLRWFAGVFILSASCPFHKVAGFFKLFIYSSNLSRIVDYFTFYDGFNLPFLSPSTSSRSSRRWSMLGLSETLYSSSSDMWKTGSIFPRGEISSLKALFPRFSRTLNGPYSGGLSFFVGRLVRMFFPFSIIKSPMLISGYGVARWSQYFFIDSQVWSSVFLALFSTVCIHWLYLVAPGFCTSLSFIHSVWGWKP